MKNSLRGLLDPLVAVLARAGVTPLGVTIAGFAVSLAGAVLVARGRLRAGALVFLAGGICDVLDGSLARRMRSESAFGAFIDSTIDRVTEIACFGALIVHFAREGASARPGLFSFWEPPGEIRIVLLLLVIAGSFLTSYTRARAEGLGLECRVGFVERPERIAALVVGLLAGGAALDAVIAALALLTLATAVQRIAHVRRLTSNRERP